MSAPSVLVMEGVDDYLRKHALEEARMYGHEVLGWLVGFSMKNEVYVLKAVKCTRYRRQSRIEAEADPTQESEVASRYPRNIGLVGLYHSHPFRSDYGKPFLKKAFEEKMFHSDVDSASLRSRASRTENYLSVVTDGKNVTFFCLDKGTKRVMDLKPKTRGALEYDEFLKSYSARINLVFEKRINVDNVKSIPKELESYLINYIYKNVDESDVDFEKHGQNSWNVRLYAFEEEVVADNVISIKKSDKAYLVNLRLKMKPEVFVGSRGEVLRAIREEIADNIMYLLRKSFEGGYLEKSNIGMLELHLGNFKIEKKEFPVKVYMPPKRRMIMRRH